MGRSVSTPRGCAVVCYQDVSEYEDDFGFDFYIEYIQEKVKSLFPSMEECSKWVGKEDHAVMSNNFAQVGISVYCGLAAIWLRSTSDDLLSTGYEDDARLSNLADAWCNRVAVSFDKAFAEYRKVGSFSNGEGVFTKVS